MIILYTLGSEKQLVLMGYITDKNLSESTGAKYITS